MFGLHLLKQKMRWFGLRLWSHRKIKWRSRCVGPSCICRSAVVDNIEEKNNWTWILAIYDDFLSQLSNSRPVFQSLEWGFWDWKRWPGSGRIAIPASSAVLHCSSWLSYSLCVCGAKASDAVLRLPSCVIFVDIVCFSLSQPALPVICCSLQFISL